LERGDKDERGLRPLSLTHSLFKLSTLRQDYKKTMGLPRFYLRQMACNDRDREDSRIGEFKRGEGETKISLLSLLFKEGS